MIFIVLNPEKVWHQQFVHLPTSPEYCSHFTLWNAKKLFINTIIHTYFRVFTSYQKKNCYPLRATPEKCHRTTLYNAQLFHLTEGMFHSSKCWWL